MIDPSVSLSGKIFEVSGSYQNAFFVAGGAIAVGTCTLSLIPFFMGDTTAAEVCEEPCEKENTTLQLPDMLVSSAGGQRNSSLYDTSNFTLRRSLSCLALSRFGDMCGTQCILDMLERETDVWSWSKESNWGVQCSIKSRTGTSGQLVKGGYAQESSVFDGQQLVKKFTKGHSKRHSLP